MMVPKPWVCSEMYVLSLFSKLCFYREMAVGGGNDESWKQCLRSQRWILNKAGYKVIGLEILWRLLQEVVDGQGNGVRNEWQMDHEEGSGFRLDVFLQMVASWGKGHKKKLSYKLVQKHREFTGHWSGTVLIHILYFLLFENTRFWTHGLSHVRKYSTTDLLSIDQQIFISMTKYFPSWNTFSNSV